jgi:molybdopterin-guanine dinucleotide biosynthesis protein B
MHAVSVAGYKDSGKTSLVEALLGALDDDTRAATVKSLHHDVEFDTPDTDTYRHRTAGADTVVGLTPSMTAEFRFEGKTDGVDVHDQLARLEGQGFDWIFVEGFKGASLPTIAVGDIEADALAGTVLFRVADGTTVDGQRLLDRLEAALE